MTTHSLTFDAVSEARPGPAWLARWRGGWPAYAAWFRAQGGDDGPSRAECEAALAEHMPELVPVHRRLVQLAGGGDRAARFLSTWCPPRYLGGCSIAALKKDGSVRLVRNYDLAPDLNEGLLLRSEWTGQPVMGMVEFLWGLSDGVNAGGLSAAVAYGGRSRVGRGFGVTTITRYVLETCTTVPEAVAVLRRVPSHMAYNIVLADRHGGMATVELAPGGGARVLDSAVTTNHQHGAMAADNPVFTRTVERRTRLERLLDAGVSLRGLADAFLEAPLFQRNYDAGFGTLFTAIYDPQGGAVTLRWQGEDWHQSLDRFATGSRTVRYGAPAAAASPMAARAAVAQPALAGAGGFDLEAVFQAIRPYLSPRGAAALDDWARDARQGQTDWVRFGQSFAL